MILEKIGNYKYILFFIFLSCILSTTYIYFKIVSRHDKGREIVNILGNESAHSKYIRQNFVLDPTSLRKRKVFSNIIRKKINELEMQNKAQSISVFFSDLSTLTRVEINPGIKYVPASLLKLPLMIAGLKIAETSPKVMTNKYLVTKDYAEKIAPSITGTKSLEIGKSYTYFEILSYAVVYSDNKAALFLRDLLMKYNYEIYKEIFTNFDMDFPDDLEANNVEFKTTATDMGRFFRILYNCNYLSPQYSGLALKILVSSEYKKGLAKYLPPKTEIAHKFGAFGNGQYFEMHDCGIVYAQNHPYILCIMSRGKKFDNLSDAIGEISKAVYDEMEKQE